MTSRCKDTTHAHRSNFDLERRLTIKAAVWYVEHVIMYLLHSYYPSQFPLFKLVLVHTLRNNLEIFDWKKPVCQIDRPQVVRKQTARTSTLILVAVFLHQLWFQVTDPAAHLQAWKLHVPAGAVWPLSFKWLTCFLFGSQCVEFTICIVCFLIKTQTACHIACHFGGDGPRQ